MKELRLSRQEEEKLAVKLEELRAADREYREVREARGDKLRMPPFSTCSDAALLYLALEEAIQNKEKMKRYHKKMAEEFRNVGSGDLHTDGQYSPEDV